MLYNLIFLLKVNIPSFPHLHTSHNKDVHLVTH